MPLLVSRPMNDVALVESSTTNTTVAMAISPVSGLLVRVGAAAGSGTQTGTMTTSVTVNGGSDVTGGALTVAAGTGARAGTVIELPQNGTSATFVNEGDAITFTPSGATGGGPVAFYAVIRTV